MKQKHALTDFLEDIEGSKNLSDRFHRSTEVRDLQIIKKTDSVPKSWSVIHFKTYPRSKRYVLPKNVMQGNSIVETLVSRYSARKFNSSKIGTDILGDILYYSAGLVRIDKKKDINTTSRRSYPSAGARYPLEVYAVIVHGERIKDGLYHYNVKDNMLEWLRDFSVEKWIDESIKEDWVKKSSVIFIITSVLERTTTKYKDRGYRYSLIEAGHLAQNIILTSLSRGFKSCPFGGFIDKKVVELLDLQLIKEVPLYMIAVGK